MDAKQIKELAYQCGADICGIASLDRFEGAPANMDPRYIMPEAKSMIVMGFRVMRGSLRGIEEGTQFYQYPSMAYGGINEIFAPAVLYQVGKVIEDEGYEAFVHRNTGARGVVSDMDGSPGNTLSPEEQIEVNENANQIRIDYNKLTIIFNTLYAAFDSNKIKYQFATLDGSKWNK